MKANEKRKPMPFESKFVLLVSGFFIFLGIILGLVYAIYMVNPFVSVILFEMTGVLCWVFYTEWQSQKKEAGR